MNSEHKISLVGTWIDQQETLSCVEYTVTEIENGYSVTAIDSYDSETGEIHKVEWDAETCTLRFCCHWPSTGRFAKCKFQLISENKLEFTFTYTDHEILVRKNA